MEKNSASCIKPAWQNCVHCPRLVFTNSTDFEKLVHNKKCYIKFIITSRVILFILLIFQARLRKAYHKRRFTYFVPIWSK